MRGFVVILAIFGGLWRQFFLPKMSLLLWWFFTESWWFFLRNTWSHCLRWKQWWKKCTTRELRKAWTFGNDWKLTDLQDTGFFEMFVQAEFACATLDSQATGTPLASAPLLVPSVNLGSKMFFSIFSFNLNIHFLDCSTLANILLVDNRPLLFYWQSLGVNYRCLDQGSQTLLGISGCQFKLFCSYLCFVQNKPWFFQNFWLIKILTAKIVVPVEKKVFAFPNCSAQLVGHVSRKIKSFKNCRGICDSPGFIHSVMALANYGRMNASSLPKLKFWMIEELDMWQEDLASEGTWIADKGGIQK